MGCTSFGGIDTLYIARACDVVGALSGTTLDLAGFEEVEPLEGASYNEEATPDDDGISYTASAQFGLSEGTERAYFERKYLRRELWVLCATTNGTHLLFRGMFMGRSMQSGQRPADFGGRNYSLLGVSADAGLWITTLI